MGNFKSRLDDRGGVFKIFHVNCSCFSGSIKIKVDIMVSYHLISEIQATHYAATRNTSVETNRDRSLGIMEPIIKVSVFQILTGGS